MSVAARVIAAAAVTWQSPKSLPLVALLVLVIAAGAATLYFPQARRLRWRWRLALIGLRVMALGALAVSMLQPVLTRPPEPRERGAVVVLVDRSHSMGIHDRRPRHSQLVELADGMGWLPPGVRPRQSETARAARQVRAELQELAAAQSQLAFATISGRNVTEAADRIAASMLRFDAAAAALLSAPLPKAPPPGAAKGGLPLALQNFRAVIERGRNGRGEAWVQSLGAALDGVERAAGLSQAQSDEELYAKNADVRRASDEVGTLSRLGLAEQSVVRPGSGLLASLPADVPVYGFAIGDATVPLPLKGPGGQPVRRLMLDTESAGTDLAHAVRAALDELRGVPVQAAVLLSDGRQPSTNAAPAARETTATAAGIPVFAVAVAPLRAAGSDLSLSQVVVPAGVHVGQPFTVRAKVHGTSVAPGRPVEVRCTVGAPPIPPPLAVSPAAIAYNAAVGVSAAGLFELPAKQVTLGADESAAVSFEVTIDEPGPRRISLRIPDLQEEITAENNVAERWLKVYPRRNKALLLADAPAWDFRFVRDALRASDAYDVDARVLSGGPLELSADELLKHDVVGLFDVAADSLDARQWEALHEAAAERGALVVTVAGADHLPAEYGEPALARWLPVGGSAATQPATLAWRQWEGAEPQYQLAFTGTADAAQRILPPLFRYLPLSPLKGDARPLLVEPRTREAAASVRPVGAGHAVFVGVDQTWRWRAAAQEQFWMSTVARYAEAPYAATSDRLWLDVGRAGAAPGEAIEVRAKLSSATGAPAQGAITVRALRGSQVVQSVTLTPGKAGRATGSLPGLAAGDYVIEASAAADVPAVRYPLRVVGQYEEELENPAGDRESLVRLAESSGGVALPLEDVRDLPGKLTALLHEPRPVTVSLWDSAYLFVFVVACLTLEWALRKRLGLA